LSLQVWLQGGGICTSLSDCMQRAKTDLGSSTNYSSTMVPTKMLSGDAKEYVASFHQMLATGVHGIPTPQC